MPELPTVAEATGLAGYEASTWQGFVFPAATPRSIVQRMADETIKVVAMKDVQDRLREQGYEPVGSSPAEFGAYIKSELAKWTKVIRGAGIKGE
jgi:tripartite-type tricarboxylate transporter receptor subunit TctC